MIITLRTACTHAHIRQNRAPRCSG